MEEIINGKVYINPDYINGPEYFLEFAQDLSIKSGDVLAFSSVVKGTITVKLIRKEQNGEDQREDIP